MKNQTKICKCGKCNTEAEFWHSGCCGVHFEGVIDKGQPIIVCEKCGKFVAIVGGDSKRKNKIYKLS